MRTYELMFISDPRVPDEDVVAMTQEIRGMLTANGGEVIREEQWGRRRLAYEINKIKEGKYTLLYLAGEGGQIPLDEVELRMRQNDRILRYLTVRTDLDLKRAGMPMPTEAGPETPGAEGEGATEGTSEGAPAAARTAPTPESSTATPAAATPGDETTTPSTATATPAEPEAEAEAEPEEGKE